MGGQKPVARLNVVLRFVVDNGILENLVTYIFGTYQAISLIAVRQIWTFGPIQLELQWTPWPTHPPRLDVDPVLPPPTCWHWCWHWYWPNFCSSLPVCLSKLALILKYYFAPNWTRKVCKYARLFKILNFLLGGGLIVNSLWHGTIIERSLKHWFKKIKVWLPYGSIFILFLIKTCLPYSIRLMNVIARKIFYWEPLS